MSGHNDPFNPKEPITHPIGPKAGIDFNEPIPHLIDPKHHFDGDEPAPHLIDTLEMSWGVLDFGTNEGLQFDASGGHFTSLPGHRYLVTARVVDATGIQKITLDGSGRFRCATDPNSNGTSFEASLPQPASIPHQEFANSGAAPTLQDLIVVMKPDIGAFDYFKLSCGFHNFNGTPGNMEYFAFSGPMTFSATATNTRGDRLTASLTTSS
jgi:hypothetical protein